MEPTRHPDEEPVQQPDTGAAETGEIEFDEELVEDIAELVDAGERTMVLNIVADLHEADVAQILTHIPFRDAERLFSWLPAEAAGAVLAELDDDFRAELLEDLAHERIAEVLDELDTDDAADILADLPDEVAQSVLPSLEDAEDVGELLGYEEDTAGGIMAREYVTVRPEWTVARATEEVRREAEEVEDVYVVFVVDADDRLLGLVSLKKLLLSRGNTLISSITDDDIVTVTADTDQEEVARLMERYDLVSLPVVDAEGRLIGRVTIDDVVDVIREEAEEDIQRMSGVAGGEVPTDSILRVSGGRLPWLLLGLLGSGVAAFVIGHFQSALQSATVLASFIPIVMATAGNAGIQSATIAVRGLASGDIWASDWLRRVSKEMVVAVINGVIAALLLGAAVWLFGTLLPGTLHDVGHLVLTAGLSLVAVIVLATTIGATVPVVLDRLGIDPALATGPFITASNDVLGILVFFLLAQALYL